MTVVLSPHLDDAVWSACSALEGSTVVTICAGVPDAGTPPTQFDVESGFKDGHQAMVARRAEDEEAGALVGFRPVHMGCFDAGYGGGPVEGAVEAALDLAAHGEPVLGPAGLHHPDHLRVAEAFRNLALRRKLKTWVYEELPYAYFDDVLLSKPTCVRTIDRARKERAVRTYESQIRPSTHLEEILSPERFTKL